MKTVHNILKPMLLIVGFVPLLWKLPYMATAWQNSPLDRWDWIFFILFALISIMLWPRLKRYSSDNLDLSALFVAVPFLLLFFASFVVDIHLMGIVAAVFFSWSMCWLVLGWRSAYLIFPAYGILALGGTSTTYWLTHFFEIAGLLIKIIVVLLLAIWLLTTLIFKFQPRKNSFCFCIVALLVILFSPKQLNTLQYQGAPFIPEFSSLQFGDFLGRKQPITEADQRFFADSKLEKYQFASDTAALGILAVHCGKDVHQIHPASHCLQAGGWHIDSEYMREVNISGRLFQITEISARKQGYSMLIWCWYSNHDFSTGSFIGFRRHWSRNIDWFTWQISTPIVDSEDESRQVLTNFLSQAPKKLTQ